MKRPEYVHEWFGRNAAAFPGRTAIERAAGERPAAGVTYGDLDRRSARIASLLAGAGAAPGTPVAIVAEEVPEVVAAILGVLRAGCVFVPLDPRLPARRLEAMAEEAAPAWYLAEERFLTLVETLVEGASPRPGVVSLDGLAGRADGVRALAAHHGAPAAPVDPGGDAPCYVYFTSGSTGRPKGIVGRLRAIDHFVRWEVEIFGLGEGVRVSQLTTPSFDAFLRDVFTPLAAGGTVCVPPTPETKLHPERLAAWLEAARVEVLHCVPAVFRGLAEAGLGPDRLPALTHVLMAGEPLLPADVKRWMAVFGERVRLVNLYGPSETTMTKFFHVVRPEDRDRRSVPIGVPMRGARAVLVDEAGKACPPGKAGEVLIRTPFRSLGYLGRPDLTDQVFVPNPFGSDPEDRVYRTGDLARVLEDGAFEFLGRRDHQVKVRGVRVETREVETLLREHGGVRDVTVTGREGPGGDTYLAAYFVPSATDDPAALRARLLEWLPEPMVPTAWVRMDALPRTPTGKVDRAALPAPEAAGGGAPHTEPRTPAEAALAALWAELLGVERVGVDRSFFEIGGHSLLAVRMLARAERALGVAVPLAAFLRAPTVEGMAAALGAGAEAAPGGPLVALKAGGARTPFFCVHPLDGHALALAQLARHLPAAQPVYALQARGLDGAEPPSESVEEMAGRYLEAVRAARPAGPYLLGGYSMGGVVALEMARRLRAAGEEVALLALLDTPAVRLPGEAAPEGARHARLAELVAEAGGAVPDGASPEGLPGLARVREAHGRAMAAYQAAPYDRRVVYFRAAEALVEGLPDPVDRWRRVARGGVEVETVPGDHFTMVRDPHAAALARALGARLAEVAGTAGRGLRRHA